MSVPRCRLIFYIYGTCMFGHTISIGVVGHCFVGTCVMLALWYNPTCRLCCLVWLELVDADANNFLTNKNDPLKF